MNCSLGIRRFADGVEHEIAFTEEAYALGISPGYEYDTDTLRFTYSSMTTPPQVFDYDMETRERVLRKTPPEAEMLTPPLEYLQLNLKRSPNRLYSKGPKVRSDLYRENKPVELSDFKPLAQSGNRA